MEYSPASKSKDIELNKSSAAPNDDVLPQNDDVLPQNDDVMISVPSSSSTLSVDQSSGTVEMEVDKSKSEQIYEDDIEVKRSGDAKEDVLLQIDDLMIAFSTSLTLSDDRHSGSENGTSFEQSGTVETGVNKFTSGQIEESAMEDIEVKSSSSANDSGLSQSDDPQVDTSFEQSGTVEASVDKLISGHIEESSMEDIEVKSSGSANNNVLSQSDDLKVVTSFEQLGTIETGVDKSTSQEIEGSAVEDFEVKNSSSANDNFLSQSDDLQVVTSFEQPGTVEIGVDNSTSGQTEVSAVEDIEVKKCDAANDSVLSQCDDVQIDTSFDLLEMVAIDVDKSTSGQVSESAVEDIEAKRSSSVNDCVLSESDDLQIDSSFELLETVAIDVDKSTSGQIGDIEVKRSGSDIDSVLCQSDDLQIDSSFEQPVPAEIDVDKSKSEHIEESTVKDIDVKRYGTANDSGLSQSDDLQVDASPELSGAIEIAVDKSTSEHIEESAVKSIEMKRSGTANDGILSQSDDLKVDTSFEQLETVETGVDKSTSQQIEESAVADIEVKSSSSANDNFISQSDDLQVDTSFEQSGTVETGVDNSTSEQIEASAVEDIEVKKYGAANDSVLSQSDDLQVDTSFVQSGTVETGVDNSTSEQIEASAVEDIEVNKYGAANDSVLSQSDDLQVDTSFEQSGMVETGVDNSTSEQIEASAVEDIEVKKYSAANDSVLSQSDDVQIDTSFELLETVVIDVDKLTSGQIDETALDDIEVKRSGSVNDCVLSESDDLQIDSSSELLGTVAIDDKLTSGQIEESVVEDIELKISGSDTYSVLCQSDDLQIDSSFEQTGPAEIEVDKSTSKHIEEGTMKDIEVIRSGATDGVVLSQSDAIPELSGTVEIDVDESTSGQIKESDVKDIEAKRSGTANEGILSQSDDLQIDASPEQLGTVEIDVDKSTSGQIEESAVKDTAGAANDCSFQSDDLLIDPSIEQLRTVEVDVDKSTSAQIEESAVKDIGVIRSGATDGVVLSQNDDLLIAVTTSLVLADIQYSDETIFEQSGTVETDVDISTTEQIEKSDVKYIEVNGFGVTNDWVISQSADLLTAGSSSALTDDQSSGPENETVFEHSGTVKLEVDKSTTEQIKKSDVKDVEANKSGAANDEVISQSDDLLIAVSSSSTLDNQSSGSGNGAIIEQSGTVKLEVDKSAIEQIEKSDTYIEVNGFGVTNDWVISQSADLLTAGSSSAITDDQSSGPENETVFEHSGTVKLEVDKSTTEQIEKSDMKDDEANKSGAANDEVISQSDDILIAVLSSSTLDDQSSGPGNGAIIEQSGTVKHEVDKSAIKQIEKSDVYIEVNGFGVTNDWVISQSADLLTAGSSSALTDDQSSGPENETDFEHSGTVKLEVDKSTTEQIEKSEVNKSGAANDEVISQSDDLLIAVSSSSTLDDQSSGPGNGAIIEQSGTVKLEVDKSAIKQIEKSDVYIEVNGFGVTNDWVISQSADLLTAGSSSALTDDQSSGPENETVFEHSGTVKLEVDKSTTEQIEKSDVKDVEANKSGAANDEVISQSDDLLIAVSSSSTLDDQSSGPGNGAIIDHSGTVKLEVDKSAIEQIEKSDVYIEVNGFGVTNDWVISQSADLLTAGSLSALTDDQSSGPENETVFEHSGTVKLEVDKSTTEQIEKSDVKDVEANKSGAANDEVISQSDDLLIAVSSSSTLDDQSSGPGNGAIIEQSGAVRLDVDKSATEQIEKSDVTDIEVNKSGAANDEVISQSDDLLIAVSSSSTLDDQSSGPGNGAIIEQSGTVKLEVDKSTTEQIEKSDVKDVEANKSGAANDEVLSQSDDLLIAVSSSSTLDDQSSGPGNGAIIEQSGTVKLEVDKSTTELIEKSDVKDIEVYKSGAANVEVISQSNDIPIAVSSSSTLDDQSSGPGNGAILEQSGTVEIDVVNAETEQAEEIHLKDIQLNILGAADDLLITVSSSSTVTNDCSSGLGNVTSIDQLGTFESDVDKSTSEQIEECALNDGLLSQSDDLLVAASSSSTLADDRSSGLCNETHSEQVGTVGSHAGNTRSDHIEEMPKPVKTHEPVKSGKNAKFNLRKSLAWDSAFFTSDGVLDADELSTMIDGGEKGIKHQLPGIEEEVYRSMDSISTLESDNMSLECLEAELFEDVRASIQKSNKASNTINSSIKVSPGNRDPHAKVSSSSKKVDLDSGKRLNVQLKPVARFKDNGSAIPQPKIIARVNSASTLTKRASLSTNAAKKDQDIVKQAHVTQRGALAAKTTQGSKVTGVIGPRRGVPKPLLSSKSSSLGAKTDPTRPSSSCSNSSSCSSGTDVKPSLNLSRKKVESKTGKLTAGPVSQTSSRISTKNKAPAPALSRIPSRLVSSKPSSSISPASSVSEWSSESTSSTTTIDQRSTSRGSIDNAVSYRSSVESASSIHSTEEKSNQNRNHMVIVPPSQTDSLSRPPSAQPTGLRMPSPKIGFFDGGKSGVRTPTGGMRSQSGLPTGPTGVKSVKLPQSKTTAAHTNTKPNPQKTAPKTSQLHPTPKPNTKSCVETSVEMSNNASEAHSKEYLGAGKDNKVDKSITESSRTPFAVKNSVYDI